MRFAKFVVGKMMAKMVSMLMKFGADRMEIIH